MTRILAIFQIKTVRSAWAFFAISVLMLGFGGYRLMTEESYVSGDPRREFMLEFYLFWFSIAGAYIAIASFALFSEKGRRYIEAQERIPIAGNRTFGWWLKWLVGCYAMGFCSIALLSVLAIPWLGFAIAEAMFSDRGALYMLVASVLWAPILYRYLK